MKQRDGEPLASRLKAAIETANTSVDALAERTKIPRSTIRYLLGEQVAVVVPARAYLRGHLLLLAREVEFDKDEASSLFNKTFPVDEQSELPDIPHLSSRTLAVSAGLAGFGVLAVILAFFGQ